MLPISNRWQPSTGTKLFWFPAVVKNIWWVNWEVKASLHPLWCYISGQGSGKAYQSGWEIFHQIYNICKQEQDRNHPQVSHRRIEMDMVRYLAIKWGLVTATGCHQVLNLCHLVNKIIRCPIVKGSTPLVSMHLHGRCISCLSICREAIVGHRRNSD